MTDLNALRKANPHIRIYSVNDPEFKLYGCVIKADTSAFCRTALTAVEFPAEGSRYTAAVPELDTLPEAAALREKYCGTPISSTRLSGTPAMNSISRPASLYCCLQSAAI